MKKLLILALLVSTGLAHSVSEKNGRRLRRALAACIGGASLGHWVNTPQEAIAISSALLATDGLLLGIYTMQGDDVLYEFTEIASTLWGPAIACAAFTSLLKNKIREQEKTA